MEKIIYLPKGSKAPIEPNTAVITVISKGASSSGDGSGINTLVMRAYKHDVANWIANDAPKTNYSRIYVVGYNEAKDHAINLDQLRSYVERSTNK